MVRGFVEEVGQKAFDLVMENSEPVSGNKEFLKISPSIPAVMTEGHATSSLFRVEHLEGAEQSIPSQTSTNRMTTLINQG